MTVSQQMLGVCLIAFWLNYLWLYLKEEEETEEREQIPCLRLGIKDCVSPPFAWWDCGVLKKQREGYNCILALCSLPSLCSADEEAWFIQKKHFWIIVFTTKLYTAKTFHHNSGFMWVVANWPHIGDWANNGSFSILDMNQVLLS